jgi:tetratricopeptide (TPR) repeat protein
MSAERDFPPKPLEPHDVPQKLAEILKDQQLLAEYQALLARARAEPGNRQALERAIEIQPKLAEPRFLLAQRELDAKKRIELLKAAIALDRRNASYWQALGESYAAIHDYKQAADAWRAAVQAGATPEQREQMLRARVDIERQRLDFEEAEKKRIADENAREIRKLKDEEIARLRALEAKVNQGAPEVTREKAEPWWNGPSPGGKAEGMLTQVDCLGKQARLIIQLDDRKIAKLLVRDASQIAIVGAKQEALGCGRQKPRRISVEYFPKSDAKLATIGDVATIEFPQ